MEVLAIKSNQEPRTIYRLTEKGDSSLPLFSTTVRAGFPSPAADYQAEAIDLNTYFSRNRTTTFLVEVEGDSLIGAHILPKDIAVVDVAAEPTDGRFVIAFLSGEFTMKRLSITKDATYLLSENPAYKPIVVTEPDMGLIWGVVVGICRRV